MEVRTTVTKGTATETATTNVVVTPNCGRRIFCLKTLVRTVAVQRPHVQVHDGRTAELTWSASAQPPVDRFEVEHRPDSTGGWSSLGTVPVGDSVQADSAKGPAYRFVTDDLEVGTHQFRLAASPSSGGHQAQVKAVGAAKTNRTGTWASEAVTARIELDEAYELAAYPNPVRERATIRLAVKEQQPVTMQVYDVLGRRMATLHDGQFPAQETRRFRLNTAEVELSSGTYFVRVRGETFATTRKMTVVK